MSDVIKLREQVHELNKRIAYLNNTIAEMRRDKEVKALRDKFAGQAMQITMQLPGGSGPNWTWENAAKQAYAAADAMLNAREQSLNEHH